MQKRCSLCRNNFNCLDNDSCWCWNRDYTKFLARIPEGTTDCICENCLTHLAEKPIVAKKKQDYVAGSNVAGVGT